MTTDHVAALKRAVAAKQAVQDAVAAEAKRIADERASQQTGDVAVHGTPNPSGSEETKRG